mmetsp:Transcript_15124/g.17126  ORF Transcript_15124/g.17126 Transcript_15124/m.17126 type:complete len:241 (+) Transcript_15124:295-1017(+)
MLRRYMFRLSALNAAACVLAGNYLLNLYEEEQKYKKGMADGTAIPRNDRDRSRLEAKQKDEENKPELKPVQALSVDPDCEDPVCGSKKNMLKGMFSNMKQGKSNATDKTENDGQSTDFHPEDCPLDRAEIGRATWRTLHTTAAYYPKTPSEEQQRAARSLVESLAVLYPCSHCREHFMNRVEEIPPKVSSRKEFSIWLCEAHNAVNEILDKPIFSCEPDALEKRWRKGDKRCWSEEPIAP